MNLTFLKNTLPYLVMIGLLILTYQSKQHTESPSDEPTSVLEVDSLSLSDVETSPQARKVKALDKNQGLN